MVTNDDEECEYVQECKIRLNSELMNGCSYAHANVKNEFSTCSNPKNLVLPNLIGSASRRKEEMQKMQEKVEKEGRMKEGMMKEEGQKEQVEIIVMVQLLVLSLFVASVCVSVSVSSSHSFPITFFLNGIKIFVGNGLVNRSAG